MNPSPNEVRQEIAWIEGETTADCEQDELFLLGAKRALEWMLGKGVSPTEFVKMCHRVQTRH